MNAPPISLAAFTHAERARFHAMTVAPAIAWPTVVLWVFVLATYFGTDILAVMGILPLWQGMLINSVAGYFAFSVVHDSLHRAISTHQRRNDFLGQTAALLGAPYVHLKLFRWAHISHHRYTNGSRDPDQMLHGAAWTLPFRWMAIDVLYLIYAIRHGDKVSRDYVVLSVWLAVVTALAFGVLTALGYGWYLVMLWFVPSRLIFMGLGFSFFWLPHVPHDTVQDDNFTRATTLRLGIAAASACTSTTRRSATRSTASRRARISRTCQTTGSARSAGRASRITSASCADPGPDPGFQAGSQPGALPGALNDSW